MTPEQIEAEYAHALGMKMRSGDKPLAVIEDGTIQSYSPRMMKLIEAMRAEMGRLREDAERYRWLRHGDHDEVVMRTYDNGLRTFDPRFDASFLIRAEELDKAIDEELKKLVETARRGAP